MKKLIALSFVLTLVGCSESQYEACIRVEEDKATEEWNSTELMSVWEEYDAAYAKDGKAYNAAWAKYFVEASAAADEDLDSLKKPDDGEAFADIADTWEAVFHFYWDYEPRRNLPSIYNEMNIEVAKAASFEDFLAWLEEDYTALQNDVPLFNAEILGYGLDDIPSAKDTCNARGLYK